MNKKNKTETIFIFGSIFFIVLILVLSFFLAGFLLKEVNKISEIKNGSSFSVEQIKFEKLEKLGIIKPENFNQKETDQERVQEDIKEKNFNQEQID